MSSLIENPGTCVRLRGANGNYLSLLPCCTDDDRVDLCTPDGEVLWCGFEIDLAEVFVKHLGLESINK